MKIEVDENLLTLVSKREKLLDKLHSTDALNEINALIALRISAKVDIERIYERAMTEEVQPCS